MQVFAKPIPREQAVVFSVIGAVILLARMLYSGEVFTAFTLGGGVLLGIWMYLTVFARPDREPYLHLDRSGIWHGRGLFQKRLRLIDWRDIYYFFELEKQEGDARSHYLVIALKEGGREVHLPITWPHATHEAIVSILREQAAYHGFHELGKEVRRPGGS
ncbi:hypothetical protein GCM10023184_26190 [Flaviaesturariibacter amylovorans]|uniref:PH domain-containing protein n=1 Tax=Flaviaesturariibacter amylovorans TaxID=1084520 RepID=A0ABP8H2A3_9BACT